MRTPGRSKMSRMSGLLPKKSRYSASVTSRIPIANVRLIVRSWGASSPPAYGSDPGTVPIRNETGPRMTANVWPEGLMNQPRSAGIAGERRPRSTASRAPPSPHRRRRTQSIAPWMPESGSEPYQESKSALISPRRDVGMASGA